MAVNEVKLLRHKRLLHFGREGEARVVAYQLCQVDARVAQHGEGEDTVVCFRIVGRDDDGPAMRTRDDVGIIGDGIGYPVDLRREGIVDETDVQVLGHGLLLTRFTGRSSRPAFFKLRSSPACPA